MPGLDALRLDLNDYVIEGYAEPAEHKWTPRLVIRRATGSTAQHEVKAPLVKFDAQDTAQRVAVEYGRALVLGLGSPLAI
jgi:hypothetical protein